MAGGLWSSGLRRDVRLYYCYKATSAMTLYRPVMFLYFRAVGLSWTQVAILEAVGAVVTVVTDVPTGYVGDRIGRRNSMLVGTLLVVVALSGISLAGSFLALVAFYPIWSLGWNFRRGSDSAWLYDRLSAASASERFSEVKGRGVAAASGVGVAGALVGGYLGARDLSLPFMAAAGLTALGLLALLALQNVERHHVREQPSPREAARLVCKELTHRRLNVFVVYYFVLFAGVLAVVFMYAQPVVENLAADAAYGGSVKILLGVLYAAISLVSAVLSYNTGFIVNRIGLRRWFRVIPLAVGVGLIGLVVVPILTLPAILLARGVSDVTRTLAGQYVNDQLDDVGRASVLSATRMVSKLAVIPFQLVSGWIADAGFRSGEVMAMAGVVLTVGAVALGRQTVARFEGRTESRAD